MMQGMVIRSMALISPHDWSDVATKSDLTHLATKADLHEGLATVTRTIVLAMVALWISGVALAVTAARLAG